MHNVHSIFVLWSFKHYGSKCHMEYSIRQKWVFYMEYFISFFGVKLYRPFFRIVMEFLINVLRSSIMRSFGITMECSLRQNFEKSMEHDIGLNSHNQFTHSIMIDRFVSLSTPLQKKIFTRIFFALKGRIQLCDILSHNF